MKQESRLIPTLTKRCGPDTVCFSSPYWQVSWASVIDWSSISSTPIISSRLWLLMPYKDKKSQLAGRNDRYQSPEMKLFFNSEIWIRTSHLQRRRQSDVGCPDNAASGNNSCWLAHQQLGEQAARCPAAFAPISCKNLPAFLRLHCFDVGFYMHQTHQIGMGYGCPDKTVRFCLMSRTKIIGEVVVLPAWAVGS